MRDNTVTNDRLGVAESLRGRSAIWTMEQDTPLRMSQEECNVKHQVVIFEDSLMTTPEIAPAKLRSNRTGWLVVLLITAAAVGYLFLTGQIKL